MNSSAVSGSETTRHVGLPPLTLAQREVALATDARLLVGAGAGSGKTSTVVQTLCYLLGGIITDVEGNRYTHPSPLQLSDIAAITFTNEAAADLKRKLRSALIACGLREMATDVDAARIGTIHGFCGDLLREFALRAGLPPALSVLADGETTALAYECASRAVQHAAQTQGVTHFDVLLTNRTIADVTTLVVEVASDSDRLLTWESNAANLRAHERALLHLAQIAREYRQEELQRLGAMDFDRMIVAVRDLLRRDERVRHAVQRQVRLLIVDEFQDVDPAQRDLAFLLSGLEFSDPDPSRLMLVGDPKQSIYKFRRADVSLWNDVARRFSESNAGRQLELSDNFRSRRGILGLVDAVVGARLAVPVNLEVGRQSFEVDYHPLRAMGADAEGDRCVEIIAVRAGNDGKARNVGEVRTEEAAAVAARIAELHASGVGHGEMAMLFSGFGAIDIYRAALRERGIPVYILRSDGFWETREVLDCLLALRAIRDTADDVALIGFLKGPFVGLRDDTLMALRAALHANGLWGALAESAVEPELCDRARQMLQRYTALRDRIPVHALLDRLVTESGFLAYLAHDPDRATQAIANIRKLIRKASAAAEQSLGEFLREVAEARVRQDREGEERLYRERADVVTITTVHSAKGLEWPIVFWCDITRGPRERNEPLQCGRAFFRLKSLTDEVDDDGEPIDTRHAELSRSMREEALSEALRLWYVAATRAKRLLVLSGVPLGDKMKGVDNMAAELRRCFPSLATDDPSPEISYVDAQQAPFTLTVRVAAERGVADDASAGDPLAERTHRVPTIALPPVPVVVARGRSRLSATQLMTAAQDASVWWRRYAFGFAPDEQFADASGVSVIARGVVVHEVLDQLTVRRYAAERYDIEELVEWAIERHDPDAPDASSEAGRSYRAQIRALVETAESSDEWRTLASLPTARSELTFTRILRDGSVIDGALDLVAMRGDVARIIDVKTGATRDDDLLAERYAVQATVYQEAVRSIAGVATSFALLSARDGRVVEVDASDVSLASLIRRLRGTDVRGVPALD